MITIQLNSSVPLSEQVYLGIRRALASGELVVGSPLPPVRQLANDLGINFNTVARAYRDLEQQGLLRSIRGRGTVVVSVEETRREAAQVVEKRLTGDFRNFLASARLAGLSRERIERMIGDEIAKSWPKEVDGSC